MKKQLASVGTTSCCPFCSKCDTNDLRFRMRARHWRLAAKKLVYACCSRLLMVSSKSHLITTNHKPLQPYLPGLLMTRTYQYPLHNVYKYSFFPETIQRWNYIYLHRPYASDPHICTDTFKTA